jgi:hypothetical protein
MPLVEAGLFDRFPGVNLVMAHGDAAWVPSMIEGADNAHINPRGQPPSSLPNPDWLPSDYIRRHCWFTFQHDRIAVSNRNTIGLAHLLWASQFPLDGSDWPSDRRRAELVTQNVAPHDQVPLLATNCAKLYRLPGFEKGFTSAEIVDFSGSLLVL